MRALAKTSREYGAVELVDRSRPEPAADEALIEVDYAGLCGSDAGIYKFKSAFERMSLPTVIGHEYTGRVVEVGDDVAGLELGDRVVERPIRSCGSCYQCKIGEENVCQDAVITGVDHDGAYAGTSRSPNRRYSASATTSTRATPRWSNRPASGHERSSTTPASAQAIA